MISLALGQVRMPQPWRLPFAVTLALLALVLLRYLDTAASIVEIWNRSATYTHAYVVPPIVAWLIWRKRAELQTIQPRPVPWMLLPLALLAAVWWVADQVAVNSATQLALAAMLVASVPLMLGWQVSRCLMFPLAFVFFAVPVGEFLTPTLMRWTANMVVAGLQLTGVPVYREGQMLIIPTGRWSVVEACGGIRYLMAAFMVGTLFAYLNYRSARRRAIFVAASILVPIVANWLRAYIIVMLGHLSNNEIATGVDHLVYGWVFFGVVVMALFYLGARWAEPDQPATPASTLAAGERAPAAAPSWWMLMVFAFGLLAVQWPWWLSPTGAEPAGTPVRLELPDALGRWQAQDRAVAAWTPEFEGATLALHRSYRASAGSVGVHLSYYRNQSRDAKLVNSNNKIVATTDKRWNLAAQGRREQPAQVPAAWRTATLISLDGSPLSATERQRVLVWQTYWIGGRVVEDDIQAKLWQAWLAVRGEPDDAAAIHLYAAGSDDADAQRQLAAFAAENFGALHQLLTQARNGR